MVKSDRKNLCGEEAECKEWKPELSHVQLLTVKEVSCYIGFTKAYIYKKMAEGKFPKAYKFSRAARWKLSDIQEWIDAHQSS